MSDGPPAHTLGPDVSSGFIHMNSANYIHAYPLLNIAGAIIYVVLGWLATATSR